MSNLCQLSAPLLFLGSSGATAVLIIISRDAVLNTTKARCTMSNLCQLLKSLLFLSSSGATAILIGISGDTVLNTTKAICTIRNLCQLSAPLLFLVGSGATAVLIMIHQRYFSPYQHPHMLLQSRLTTHLNEIKSVNSGGLRVQTTPRIVILTRRGGRHSATKLLCQGEYYYYTLY